MKAGIFLRMVAFFILIAFIILTVAHCFIDTPNFVKV